MATTLYDAIPLESIERGDKTPDMTPDKAHILLHEYLRASKLNVHRDTVVTLLDDVGDVNLRYAETLFKEGAFHSHYHRGKTSVCLMHVAVNCSTTDVIRVLLDRGAKVNIRTSSGIAPLHVALTRKPPLDIKGVMELLLEAGADIHCVDIEGLGVLHWAVATRATPEILQFLIMRGCDVNSKDKNGSIPLHMSHACDVSLEVMQLFVSNRCDITCTNKFGLSPLHNALLGQPTLEGIQFLLDSGCDKNGEAANGCTPLHMAMVDTVPIEVVKLLICSGCRVNAKNDQGYTPLMWGIHLNSIGSVDYMYNYLLEDGYSPNYTGHQFNPHKEFLRILEGNTVFTLCTRYRPDLALDILDRSIHLPTCMIPNNDESYMAVVDFSVIEKWSGEHYLEGGFCAGCHPVQVMMEHDRNHLITHPVTVALCHIKWELYGRYFFYGNFALYILFLISLTGYAHYTAGADKDQNFVFGWGISLLIFTIIRLAVEMVQLLTAGQKSFFCCKISDYFLNWENAMEVVKYVVVCVWVTGDFIGKSSGTVWQLGILAVFLGWLNLLLFIRKVEYLGGLYALMYITIIQTFMKVVILLLVVLLAFSIPFSILFQDTPVFRMEYGMAIWKSLVMATGELGYDEEYLKEADMMYPVTTFIIFIVFVVMVPILFMTLATGLAVSDVRVIQSESKVEMTKMKLKFIYQIEGFLIKIAHLTGRKFFLGQLKKEINIQPNVTVLQSLKRRGGLQEDYFRPGLLHSQVDFRGCDIQKVLDRQTEKKDALEASINAKLSKLGTSVDTRTDRVAELCNKVEEIHTRVEERMLQLQEQNDKLQKMVETLMQLVSSAINVEIIRT